jgi:polyisoprenoid-binding protein YceI
VRNLWAAPLHLKDCPFNALRLPAYYISVLSYLNVHAHWSSALTAVRRSLSTVLLVAAGAAPLLAQAPAAAASPDTWTIDPNHTASQFAVKHLMVSTVRGQFEKTTGTITWDGKDPTKIRADVTIDAATVNTRVENRDADLKSANFFDVAKYPTITFVSKKVETAGSGKLRMTGDLTMRGVTKEVVLDVDSPAAPVKQGQNLRVGASASVKINRHDWGLSYSRAVEAAPVVGDEITITLDIEATRRAN